MAGAKGPPGESCWGTNGTFVILVDDRAIQAVPKPNPAHLLGAGGILPVIAKSPMPIEASSLIKSAWTEVPGGPIHYRVGGAPAEELPIVLLIHGLVVASTYMVPTAEQLAPFCRVYSAGSSRLRKKLQARQDLRIIRACGCSGRVDGCFRAQESSSRREFIRLPNHS